MHLNGLFLFAIDELLQTNEMYCHLMQLHCRIFRYVIESIQLSYGYGYRMKLDTVQEYRIIETNIKYRPV